MTTRTPHALQVRLTGAVVVWAVVSITLAMLQPAAVFGG